MYYVSIEQTVLQQIKQYQRRNVNYCTFIDNHIDIISITMVISSTTGSRKYSYLIKISNVKNSKGKFN